MPNANTTDPRSLSLVLAAIFLMTLPHAQNVAGPIFAFFSVMCLWRALALRWPALLPNRWLLLVLMLAGIGLLVFLHSGLFGRDAGTSVLIVALGLKLLEIRGRRDIELVAYLAFVVAASQFLYAQTLPLVAYVVAMSIVLLTTLTAQTVQQIQTRAALRSALIMLAQALPLTALLFVVFPRIQAPHWSWLESQQKGKSGLGRDLEPGALSELSLSDELVFRAQFGDEVPANPQRYWRGVVYSITDGKRWSSLELSGERRELSQCLGKRYQYRILQEPQKEAWLLGLDRMVESQETSSRQSLKIDQQEQVTRRDGGHTRQEFALSSCAEYRSTATPQELRANLQLPASASPAIRALIQQLQNESRDPRALVEQILTHFRTHDFSYTLKPPPLGDHPVDDFLFRTHSGFCSHYATAFVYLMRVAGVPARVIGGYQGGAYNPAGQFIEVRQADAHAWAEVWLEPHGWVRVDPTAAISPERIERGVDIAQQLASGDVNFYPSSERSSAAKWLKHAHQFFSNLDYQWQHWIVNFDSDIQNQLFNGWGMTQLVDRLRGVVVIFIAVGLMLLVWLMRGRNRALAPEVAEYQKFCAKMAKAGLVIGTGEGERDFALRAQQARPDLASGIAQITALYIRLRYEAAPQRGDLLRLRQSIKALRV